MFLHEMASVSLDYVKEDMVNYICGNNYQNRNNYQFYIVYNNYFFLENMIKVIHNNPLRRALET